MARRRRAAEGNPSTSAGRVQSPFTSSPGTPPKYSIYYTIKEGDKLYTQSWGTCFGAKKAIDYLLQREGLEWEWIDKDKIFVRLADGTEIEVRGDKLEEVIEYEWLNEHEEEWELPIPFNRELDRLCGIKFDSKVSEESQLEEKPDGTKRKRRTEPADDNSKDAGGEGDTRRTRRGQGGGKQSTRDGYVGLAAIAADLKMEARDARAILRKKIEKPSEGWQWPEKEVEKIKKLLK